VALLVLLRPQSLSLLLRRQVGHKWDRRLLLLRGHHRLHQIHPYQWWIYHLLSSQQTFLHECMRCQQTLLHQYLRYQRTLPHQFWDWLLLLQSLLCYTLQIRRILRIRTPSSKTSLRSFKFLFLFLINVIIMMLLAHFFFVIWVYTYVYILLLWMISMHVLKHIEQFYFIL